MYSDADIARLRSTAYGTFALALSLPTAESDPEAGRRCATVLADLMEACGADRPGELARRLGGSAPSAEQYERLFGHTAEGKVPPYETHYGDDTLLQQPRELADLGAFFTAFGLAVRPESHERGDHVCCECELMAFLSAKEGYALDHREEEMLAVTRQAESAFLRDHLGRFAPAFGERLRRADPDGFYGDMGRLLRAFVEWDCERQDVEVGSPMLSLRRPSPDEGAPMACGSAGGCPLGAGD